MVVADFTNLISRHVQTSKTCCRLILIYNRIADLQQNRRFTTTMNPDPEADVVDAGGLLTHGLEKNVQEIYNMPDFVIKGASKTQLGHELMDCWYNMEKRSSSSI